MLDFELTSENIKALSGIVVGLLVFIIVAVYRYIETTNEEKHIKLPRAEFSPSDPDIVIIGGGFTGATLAAVLGADGRRVVVIERDMSPPDTYRGENLIPGGVVAIEALGLKPLLDTVPGNRCDGFVYNDTTIQESVVMPLLTVNGYTVRHGDLVDALRKHAKTMKGVTFIEAVAKDMVRENGRVVGVTYKVKGSDETKTIRAPLTVVCDGFFSSFRKQFTSLPKPEFPSTFIGVEMGKISFPGKDKHWIQFFFGNPLAAYFIYNLGGDANRILIEVKGEAPKNVTGFLCDTLAPTMPDHVKKPLLEALEKRKATAMRIKRSSGSLDNIPLGVLLVGDMFDTRDPVAGTGMTSALRDIGFWRKALRGMELDDDDAMMRRRAAFKQERHSWAWAINTGSHVVSSYSINDDVGTCRLRQQFIRALKQVESGTNDEKQATTDVLYAVNTDPAALKGMLEVTRRDAIRYAFQSRPWTGLFSAIREAIAIHFKFNDMCGAAFKQC